MQFNVRVDGVNSKEHLCSVEGLWNFYAKCANIFAYVSLPSYPVEFCEALVPVHLSGAVSYTHLTLPTKLEV